ncbi:MAG: dihydroxy-acid dehydratase, partial [Paracoccaceae bacterium]
IGHISPEAALGGAIGLIEEGDELSISISGRSLHLNVEPAVLASRRTAMEAKGAAAWTPVEIRPRKITAALKVFAAFATSASEGAARDVDGALASRARSLAAE